MTKLYFRAFSAATKLHAKPKRKSATLQPHDHLIANPRQLRPSTTYAFSFSLCVFAVERLLMGAVDRRVSVKGWKLANQTVPR